MKKMKKLDLEALRSPSKCCGNQEIRMTVLFFTKGRRVSGVEEWGDGRHLRSQALVKSSGEGLNEACEREWVGCRIL